VASNVSGTLEEEDLLHKAEGSVDSGGAAATLCSFALEYMPRE
jgi:hypothetical protein